MQLSWNRDDFTSSPSILLAAPTLRFPIGPDTTMYARVRATADEHRVYGAWSAVVAGTSTGGS